MAGSSLVVGLKIVADDRASKALGRTRAGVESISRALERMRSQAVGAFGVLQIGRLAREAVRTADEIRLVNARLRQAAGSQRAFAAAQAEALEIAQRSGVAYASVAQLYARLALGARQLGIDMRDIATVTGAVVDALRISGANTAEAASVTLQLSQALASGVLRGDEFRAVMENGSRIALALAEALGVTVGELRAMAEQGQLTTGLVVRALAAQAATLRREAAAMPRTVGQAVEAARNAFSAWIDQVANAGGVTDALVRSLDALAAHLGTVLGTVAVIGVGLLGRQIGVLTAAGWARVRQLAAEIATERQAALVRAEHLRLVVSYAEAELAAAQAAAAATSGMARLIAVESAVIPAQQRLAAAQAAYNAALAGTGVAAGIASRALALAGGPLGLVLTLVTAGAAAWALYGRRAEDAGARAREAALDIARQIGQRGRFGGGEAGILRAGIADIERELRRLDEEAARIQAQNEARIRRGLLPIGDAAIQARRRELQRQLAELRAALDRADEETAAGGNIARELALRQWDELIAGLRTREERLKGELQRIAQLGRQAGKSPAEIAAAQAAVRAKVLAEEEAQEARRARELAAADDEAARRVREADQRRAEEMLQQSLDRRLISYAEFFRRRTALRLQALDEEIAATERAIERESALLDAADADTRARAQAEIARLGADLTNLMRERERVASRTVGDVADEAISDIRGRIDAARRLIAEIEQAADARVRLGLESEAEARARVRREISRQAETLRSELIPQIEALARAVTDPQQRQALEGLRLQIAELLQAGEQSGVLGGLRAGLADVAGEAGQQFELARRTVQDAFQGMEDALVKFVTTGKLSFRDLVDSILADLARLAIRQAIIGPLATALQRLFGGPAPAKPASTRPSAGFGQLIAARGAVVAGGTISDHSGRVVDRPTLFRYATRFACGGLGLMGEAGPEAILPLRRGPDGRLGVEARAAGAPVTVIVENNGGPPARVEEQDGPDGGRIIRVIIDAAVSEVDRRIAQMGSTGRAIQGRFGLTPAAGTRG
ncbi:MAG: hypothetical protein KatS3mg119_1882 [Rhodothalassiaceae bacterium]|nr:MAG: hypothetical protein KatS3mg119_1882 [Rhodothalassiaceae bacterium]